MGTQTTVYRAGHGDESAFREIVERHQGMVYSIAWNYLHNRPFAEEVAQEVFFSLYRHLGSIESEAHLVQWLRRATANRSIDEGRRLRIRPRVGLEDAPEPSVRGEGYDVMLGRLLHRSIASLPERARMLVLLRYQEDMDPAEIAETLGMPVGTVKSSLHRALGVLRARIERASKAKDTGNKGAIRSESVG